MVVRANWMRVVAAGAALLVGACASAPEERDPLEKTVRFEGQLPLPADQLRELVAPWISDFVATGGSAAYLDDAAFEIATQLRNRGYPDAAAEYRIEPGGAAVVFGVEAGSLAVLGELTVTGTTFVDGEEAEKFFLFPRPRIDEVRRTVFTVGALRDGRSALEQYYYDSGYLDVEIPEPVVSIDRDSNRAVVQVEVVEGRRYRVGRLEITGPLALEASDVESVVAPFRGRPYDPRLPFELRNELLERYGNRGRPDTEVQVRRTVDRDRALVDIDLTVAAGEVVWVSEVRVVGNRDTRQDFVLDRVLLGVGERYSREKARKSFERLYRTGLFSRVAVYLAEEDGSHRPLLVELEEGPSQEVFVEPGYGAYELFRLKAGYRELNLFGTGRQLRVEGAVAVRAQSAEVGISDPDFFDQDLFADLSQGYDRREFPSFTRTEASTVFSLRWPWTRHLEGYVAYQYRDSRLSNIDVVDPVALLAEEDIDISSISFSPRYDSRDRLFVPQAGQITNLNLEWGSDALGSELEFLRTTFKAARYFTLDGEGDSVLALGGEIGAIYPQGETEIIPLQERFFNGGPKTVRAFKQYELGPIDAGGEQIGGEGYTVFSAELRQRWIGRLQWAAFADYGTVVPDVDDVLQLDEIDGGVGLGLRYVLPVGPLRIDLAFNTDPAANEDEAVLHIAVGMPF